MTWSLVNQYFKLSPHDDSVKENLDAIFDKIVLDWPQKKCDKKVWIKKIKTFNKAGKRLGIASTQ